MADLPVISNDAQPTVVVDATSNTSVAKVDSLGNQYVAAAPVDGFKTTYSSAVTGLVTATTATDIVAIGGSATKTVRIVRLIISATQTTAGDNTVMIIKRSTADTGGTSITQTAVSHDSNNVGATATFQSYTANPTLGTAVGTVASDKIFIATTASNAASSRLVYEWGLLPEQAIILRGVAQQLCVNLNSTTIVGSLFNIWAEWTEE